MATVEAKVDMSLDEIISKRQSEAKKEKRVSKKPLKFSPGKFSPMKEKNGKNGGRQQKRGKVTSGAVAMEAGKLKREAKIAAKRGLATEKVSEKEIAKKATAKVAAKVKSKKKTVVNLAKKSPLKQHQKKKPVMELPASSEERAVKVKDFTLPKDTKMVITYASPPSL